MIQFRHPRPDRNVGTNYQYRYFTGRLGVAVQLICQRPLEAIPGNLIMIPGHSDKDRLIESDRWLPQREADHSKRHEEEQYRAD